ncbi:hypothetical protein AAZV13_12G171050 [Glycine max]
MTPNNISYKRAKETTTFQTMVHCKYSLLCNQYHTPSCGNECHQASKNVHEFEFSEFHQCNYHKYGNNYENELDQPVIDVVFCFIFILSISYHHMVPNTTNT